jgi:hypothetical protein
LLLLSLPVVVIVLAISSFATFGWLLSVSPTIAIAADVFIVAATTPATATTAAAVAGIIARCYRRQHYCRYCHHGEFLRDRHDTDSMVSVIFYTANDLYQYWCQVGINQE